MIELRNKHFKQYTRYNKYLFKLITTQMAKAFQLYASFTIEGNEVIFFKNEIFPIDSMITNNGQISAMLLEI